MRWVLIAGIVVAFVGVLGAIRIEHGDGRILLNAQVKVSSPSGSQSGVTVELVHRFGGILGFPRVKHSRVCVTDHAGICEGKVDYQFSGQKIHLIHSFPRSTWQLELFARGRRVATHRIVPQRGQLSGAPYSVEIQIP